MSVSAGRLPAIPFRAECESERRGDGLRLAQSLKSNRLSSERELHVGNDPDTRVLGVTQS